MLSRFKIAVILLGTLTLSACQTLPENNQTLDFESNQEEAPRFVVRASDASRWTSSMVDDEAGSVTLRERDVDLWALTAQKMALDYDPNHPTVQARLDWYKEHDRYLDRVAVRASRYYYYILHEVIEREIPAEIALLPAIESSYDPFVKSPARAAGPWQFIPSTGDHFGLKRNWWYDGRQDIIA